MAREWLNHSVDASGQWSLGQPDIISSAKTVAFSAWDVDLFEVAASGMVLLSPAGRTMEVAGGAAVAVKATMANGATAIIAGPVHTPVRLLRVQQLELSIRFGVAAPLLNAVSYRALFNAHCTYERVPVQCDVMSGTQGMVQLNQSFGETRGVDVTVLGTGSCVTTALTLAGLNLTTAISAVIGARIYDAASHALVAQRDIVVQGQRDHVIVTLPIAATLTPNKNYRIGFYVEANPSGASSGHLFEAAAFPYVDGAGMLRVNSAHSVVGDVFPAAASIFTPQMSLAMRPA